MGPNLRSKDLTAPEALGPDGGGKSCSSPCFVLRNEMQQAAIYTHNH